ncbi:peptidoglycan bridge formation glycyltransferase FemA/FemB family protein [Thermodesulfobacteriota bacterium]
MIHVDSYTAFDESGWRRLIEELNGGPLLIPNVWSNGADDSLLYLIFKKDGDDIGAALALPSSKSLLQFLTVSKSLFLPTVPAIKQGSLEDQDEIYEIYEALMGFCSEKGYRELKQDTRWGYDFSGHKDLRGFIQARLIEFVVDLRLDSDTILKSFHKKHRKNIRIARESGLQVVMDKTLDGVMALRAMQQDSSRRSIEKGNPYQVQDEEVYRALFENVYCKDFGNILFAQQEGEYVASLAYLVFDRKAITVRSGATPKGYELFAMYLLQYELIERLKEQGVEELNIGGVPAAAREAGHPQHGLYDYKRYYGGMELMRTSLKITIK